MARASSSIISPSRGVCEVYELQLYSFCSEQEASAVFAFFNQRFCIKADELVLMLCTCLVLSYFIN